MTFPSALNQGYNSWTSIPPENHASTLTTLLSLTHSKAHLKRAYFPLAGTTYRAVARFYDQKHLTLLPHCQYCGQDEAPGSFYGTCASSPSRRHIWKPRSFDATTRIYVDLPYSAPDARAVVALDCEMVQLSFGREYVVHLSAVDVLTGDILMDAIVAPPADEKVVDWRTAYTGLTASKMSTAVSEGRTLAGMEKAREELFRFVDKKTVVVGFAVQHDFEALRLRALQVVDFQVLFFAMTGRTVGLKKTCLGLLGKRVQEARPGVQGGHVCLEDVMASRELVLYWIEKGGRVKTYF